MSQSYFLHKGDADRPQIRDNAIAFINRLPDSHSWEILVRRHVKRRTDDQNHALFGVAYKALSEATGFTKDELHDAFCKRFFGTVTVEVFGQVRERAFRTTTVDEHGNADKLPADEFWRFYEMVQQVGAESGIDVPNPDPAKKRIR